MKNHPLRASAFVLMLAFVLPVSAQTVFNGTASTVTQMFLPYDSDWEFGNPATSHMRFSVPSPGTFSYSFASAGDVTMRVTWNAPAGQQFVLTAPVGFSTTTLSFGFVTGESSRGGGFSTSSPNVSFENLSGAFSGATSQVIFTAPGDYPESYNRFSANYTATLSPSETVSFTSLTLEWLVPASYNNNFSGATIWNYYVQGTASQNANVADPEAWLSLVAIPEPATYGAVLGLLPLAATWMERCRRQA